MSSPPPRKPVFPTRWIPIGMLGVFLTLWGFLFGQPLLTLSSTGTGLFGILLLFVTGYQFLQYGADYDLFDWWHGPGNSDNPNRKRRR